MDGDQARARQQQFLQAVIGNAFQHIVGVVYTLATPVDGSHIFVGSGFCTTIEGRAGWITARHIVDDIRLQSERNNLLGNALLYGSADVGMFLFTLDKGYFDQATAVPPDEEIDVTFVSLPDNAMQKIAAAGIKQIESSRASSTAEALAGIFLAYGFAAHGSRLAKTSLLEYFSRGEKRELSQVRLEGVGLQSVLLKWSAELPSEAALVHTPETDTTVREHTMFPAVELQDATGMSGGPILYHDYQDANLAEFRLFGIQSRQSKAAASVKSMTFADACYSLKSLRSQLAT